MLVSLSSYSQYPTVKTIGKDTVVIMTIKQGEDINNRFTFLNDSIKRVNTNFEKYMLESGQRLQKMYTNYHTELNNHKLTKQEADSIKALYLANKKIYEHRENEFRKERISQQVFTFIVLLITVIIAGSK